MQIHPIPKPLAGAEPALPAAALCYVAGAGGLYKVVRNAFYTARVKVDRLPSLAELAEQADLHVPLLPAKLFRQVEAFFRAVYELHKSEAVVLLYCNPQAKSWRVAAPPQAVRGLQVEYDLAALPKPPAGFELFGTIHSHANVGAFHSGTDDADEAHFDGLHITIGHVDQPVRSYACRWILAGRIFKAELGAVLEDENLPEPEKAWLDQVVPARAPDRLISPFAAQPVGGCQGEFWHDDWAGSFASREDYLEYLETLRDEIDTRMLDAEILEHEGGQNVSIR